MCKILIFFIFRHEEVPLLSKLMNTEVNSEKSTSGKLRMEDVLIAETELYSLMQQKNRESAKEEPEEKSVILMGDCDYMPPTVVINDDLIVDFKYAFFHHDAEDVQQNVPNFIESDDVKSIILCSGDDCKPN